MFSEVFSTEPKPVNNMSAPCPHFPLALGTGGLPTAPLQRRSSVRGRHMKTSRSRKRVVKTPGILSEELSRSLLEHDLVEAVDLGTVRVRVRVAVGLR